MRRIQRWAFALVWFVSSVLLYQNCGAPKHLNVTEQAAFFSGSCEAPLMNAFGNTYYPFFKNKCARCHETGPGLGYFSSKNFETAFSSFNNLGRNRIERNFLNPGHQAGLTGPQNQPIVDRGKAHWDRAEMEFKDCAKKSGMDFIPGDEVLTKHKANAAILANARNSNPWVQLRWDLETEMAKSTDNNKYQATFSIEVRAARSNDLIRGYEFRNPVVRLKANAMNPIRIAKILFSINDSVISDVTTFTMLNSLVNVTTMDTNMAAGSGWALAVLSPTLPTDTFAIAFGKIELEPGPIDADPGGGTDGGVDGGMEQPLPTSVTYTQLTSTDMDLGVFRRVCFGCHTGAGAPKGLNLTDFTLASAAVSKIVERTNDMNNPMPPSGLLSDRDRAIIKIWQMGGAAQ